MVSGVRWEHSPVGGYLELAVGEPARRGARIAVWVSTMVVDTPEARLAGRQHWGFPKELGTLTWAATGRHRTLRWEERRLALEGEPYGPSLPAIVPVRCVQQREDGLVVVSGRLRGCLRPARVSLSVPDDDPLAALAGSHVGFGLSGLRLSLGPAVALEPSTVVTAAAAPQEAADPAMFLDPGGALTRPPP